METLNILIKILSESNIIFKKLEDDQKKVYLENQRKIYTELQKLDLVKTRVEELEKYVDKIFKDLVDKYLTDVVDIIESIELIYDIISNFMKEKHIGPDIFSLFIKVSYIITKLNKEDSMTYYLTETLNTLKNEFLRITPKIYTTEIMKNNILYKKYLEIMKDFVDSEILQLDLENFAENATYEEMAKRGEEDNSVKKLFENEFKDEDTVEFIESILNMIIEMFNDRAKLVLFGEQVVLISYMIKYIKNNDKKKQELIERVLSFRDDYFKAKRAFEI